LFKKKLYTIKILLAILIVITTISCAPETRYKVLSFFFDGVPNPEKIGEFPKDTLDKSQPQLESTKSKQLTINIHKPYEDRTCETCHEVKNSFKLISKEPDLCYNCHESQEKDYKFVHGPVASGYCTECHNPHSSEYAKLIIKDDQNLCYKCHQKSDVMANEIHADIGITKCWDCHNPHGGADRTMQR
jgi:predicted CXXCH cytochrome family protein